jgi:hypothetical protein
VIVAQDDEKIQQHLNLVGTKHGFPAFIALKNTLFLHFPASP